MSSVIGSTDGTSARLPNASRQLDAIATTGDDHAPGNLCAAMASSTTDEVTRRAASSDAAGVAAASGWAPAFSAQTTRRG